MAKNQVTLRPHNFIPYTLVPNFFIDQSLAKANGEFVKVYLVLLRYLSVAHLTFDLSQIADLLLMTESDVLRALNYFQSEKLLTLTFEDNRLKEIHLANVPNPPLEPAFSDSLDSFHPSKDYAQQTPSSTIDSLKSSTYDQANSSDTVEAKQAHLHLVQSKPEYTTQEISRYAEQDEFQQLLYIIQKYLGKTLSVNEIKTIVGFHDWLGLPLEVIELMIEYCVSNDHRNMRYIEKVAIDWADQGITTICKAKARTETYNKSYFAILKAYGITDRTPTPNQIKIMDRWLEEYQLDVKVITEACQRTITQINKPEMRYTESILRSWYEKGVHTLSDLAELDENKSPAVKQTYAKGVSENPSSYKNNSKGKKNAFNAYEQRDYDYDALEKKALELRMKKFDGKRFSS